MSLIDEQERMRRRNIKKKEIQEHERANRTICISCKSRQARKGQAFCSRCTATGLVNELRDQLPSPIPITNLPSPQLVHQDGNEKKDEAPTLVISPSSSYTRAQVVRMLGISVTTLSRWEKKGLTPPPYRVAHNNQCRYTDEMIATIKEYMTREYIPPPSQVHPGTPLALATSVKKTVKINRRLERAVASRLGSLGRRVF